MKKILLIFTCIVLIMPLLGDVQYDTVFLATAEDVNAAATATNGTEFDSIEIGVSRGEWAAITVTFTRVVGAADEVDFEFQVSYDRGTTWSSAPFEKISLATNTVAVTNVVIHTEAILVPGVDRIRLSIIRNNDGATNLTACNATFSKGRY